MRTLRSVVPALLLPLVLACGDRPVGPEALGPIEATAALAGQDGAMTAEIEGFRFLPPIGRPARGPVDLQEDLLPWLTLEVCRVDGDACAEVVASFDARTGGGDALRIEDDAFRTEWHTRRSNLDPKLDYRIRVRVGPFVLGRVEIDVVRGRGGAGRSGDGPVVQAGRTLPVAFQVEAASFWSDLPGGLAFSEDAPAPGRVGAIRGVAMPASSDVAVLVQGSPAPVSMVDGTLLTAIPLFVDGGGRSAPPSGRSGVMVFAEGRPIAWEQDAFEVSALPDAPGTAERTVVALESIVTSLERVGSGAVPVSVEEGWLTAATTALEEMIGGPDGGSLRNTLAAADPETLRLVDGWLAASGLAVAIEDYAAALDAVMDGLASVSPGGLAASAGNRGSAVHTAAAPLSTVVPTPLPGTILAERMQLYEVVKLIGEVVIAETSTEFGTYVGLAASALGLIGTPGVGAAGTVGAVLSVADFVINKLLIGLLPADVEHLDLSLSSTTLAPGEETISFVRVRAANVPTSIGVQDIISQTLTVLGVAANNPAAQNFRDVLIDVAHFYATTMQSALAAYAAEHPELNMDVSVASLPMLAWEAQVFDPDLVEPRTPTPDLVTPLTDRIEWRASEQNFGTGRVFVQTGLGPEALRLELPPGILYTGGAFGNDVVRSEDVVVNVVGELVLEVNLAGTIAADGFNVLEARAGYLDAEGNPVWTGGIWIELLIDGGTVETAQGPTDADGQFITLVRLDEGSDRVIVSVSAYDDTGQQVTRTVESSVETPMPGRVIPLRNNVSRHFVQPVSARAQAPGGNPASRTQQDAPGMFEFGAWGAGVSASASGTFDMGSTTASANASVQRAIIQDDGGVRSVTVSGSVSARASGSNRSCCIPASGLARVPVELLFRVLDAPVEVEVAVSCTIEGGSVPFFQLSIGSVHIRSRDDPSACSDTYTTTLEPGTHGLIMGALASASQPGNASSSPAVPTTSVQFDAVITFGPG